MSAFEKEIEHVEKLATAKYDHRPPSGGWADGNYLRKCFTCEAGFFGDKRAVTCADFAYDAKRMGKDGVLK